MLTMNAALVSYLNKAGYQNLNLAVHQVVCENHYLI